MISGKSLKKLSILLLLGSLIGCESGTGPVILPEYSETGSNTMGMYVNGHPWVPKDGPGWGEIVYSIAVNTPLHMHQQLDLYAINIPNDESLNLRIARFTGVGEYSLANKGQCWFWNEKDQYLAVSGSIKVTHFDTVKHIVAGRFEFRSVGLEMDTIHITDGRFDATYHK